MNGEPLVSVVTATWNRHKPLLERCIPSVQEQAYPAVEHIIVSDGPDPELRGILQDSGGWGHGVRYGELPEHAPERHWGGAARRAGIGMAAGNLIAYCDDDDTWEPDHLTVLAAALTANPAAGFAYPRMVMHVGGERGLTGDGRCVYGRVVSSMILHRREILDAATWGDDRSPDEDWLLVRAWLDAGIRFATADEVTVHYYPYDPGTTTIAAAAVTIPVPMVGADTISTGT